jgi:hypothetical protein
MSVHKSKNSFQSTESSFLDRTVILIYCTELHSFKGKIHKLNILQVRIEIFDQIFVLTTGKHLDLSCTDVIILAVMEM